MTDVEVILKQGKLLLFVFFVSLFSGCSKTEIVLKTKDVKVDESVKHKIYDMDMIVESKQDGKIFIHTVKIPLEKLNRLEEKSYSKKFLALTKNNQEELYRRIDEYLNSYDFSVNEYALYNNRFDSVDKGGRNKKRFINKPIINNGKIIGELIFRDNAFHCFSYELIYVSKSHLYATKIELYRINSSILENQIDYFEKKNNDFLPYHWISDEKRLEFYRILESDDCKKLPVEFQLLRNSKDLFLNSLTIDDD